MPITTYRGEKTVGEIADKMFERLTPRQKETVEAAILKANPRLADPQALSRGTILKVPDIAELRPKSSRALENPDALLTRHLADMLDTYGKHLDARSVQASDDSRQQLALLKDSALKRALGSSPALQELAAQITKSQSTREKDLEARRKSVAQALLAMRAGLDP